MNTILQNIIDKFCFVYVDDIIVYSVSIHEHYAICSSESSLSLGMLYEGVPTEPLKVEAVQNFPVPKTVKEVQRFLGLTG